MRRLDRRAVLGIAAVAAGFLALYAGLLLGLLAFEQDLRGETDREQAVHARQPAHPPAPRLAPHDADRGRFVIARADPVRDFEQGNAGWMIVPPGRAPSSAKVSDGRSTGRGRRSIEVPVRFPAVTTLTKKPSSLGHFRFLTYDVHVPADVPAGSHVYALFSVSDKDGLWFQAGATQIHLILEYEGSAPAGFDIPADLQASRAHHVAFEVADSRQAAEQAAACGVPILWGPKQRPDGFVQTFVGDPDGHVVELCSPPSD